MGKSQKKRAARRHNPVRVPDSHLPKGLDAAEATSSRSADVLPIIQKVRLHTVIYILFCYLSIYLIIYLSHVSIN